MPLVYGELRRIASPQLRHERPDHTLHSGDLVNEAYLRLAGQRDAQWQHRGQFFAIAARMMRRILVDHARGRCKQKRGGGAVHVDLDEARIAAPNQWAQLIALDIAMEKLEA